jgi:predicted Zn-dependent protease
MATNSYQAIRELLENRQPREALVMLEPLIADEPDNLSLRVLRAWALFARAALGPAEQELRRIVEADPSDVWARFTLGRTLERQSRLAEALPHLRLAFAMSGDIEHELAVLRVERSLGRLGAD